MGSLSWRRRDWQAGTDFAYTVRFSFDNGLKWTYCAEIAEPGGEADRERERDADGSPRDARMMPTATASATPSVGSSA